MYETVKLWPALAADCGTFCIVLGDLNNFKFFNLNVDQHKVSFHIAVQSETHNLLGYSN